MKSARISFRRSARASRHRTCENGGRTVFVSKCLARAQSFERSETADASPLPVEHGSGEVAKKRPSDAIDLETLLHFSQQLYAHALTLQEVIRNEGEATYEMLRPKFDRQAAQQFEVFYHTFKQP
ncbi:MAG: hypothetical protein WBQ10_22090 [Terriglobales bacterium]